MDILPSPQQLRYLITLLELRHFGKAAQACSVTQSTLSAGILTLERQLDITILDRTAGKRVIFTPLGEEIAAQAKVALHALESVREVITSARDPFILPLKLGIIPTIAPFILPYMVKGIKKYFPKLQFTVHEDMTDRLMEKLSIGHLDLLIIAMPCRSEGAETYALFDDDFYIIFPKGHELERFEKVPIGEIPTKELISLHDGHCLRDQTLDMCHQIHAFKTKDDAQTDFVAASLATLIELVAAGAGVAFLPKMAIDSHILHQNTVSARPLMGEGTYRTVGLAWRQHSLRAIEFKKLEILFDELKNPAKI